MTESNDLDRRVTRLEHEMAEVRQDTSLTRTIARDAGLDVSIVHAELRAHTRTLNALRETQAEHSRTLREHSQRFDRLERKVDHGFSMMSVGMAHLTALLTPERDKPDEG